MESFDPVYAMQFVRAHQEKVRIELEEGRQFERALREAISLNRARAWLDAHLLVWSGGVAARSLEPSRKKVYSGTDR
jgi:hypothetical protein